MVTYLLKSTACLLVFYLFYHFVLERQTNHSFKRYYLLASLVAGPGDPGHSLGPNRCPAPAHIR